MALTLTQLSAIAKHAIGGDPAGFITDAATTKTHFVNQAGQLLSALHEWNYLKRPSTLLSFVADQTYVALPSDLAELTEIVYNAAGGSVVLTTLATVDEARAQNIGYGNQYLGAVSFPTQTGVTLSPGAPRLELHPTPTASTADILICRYRAGWTVLSSGTDVANVPVWIEPLLEDCVRAVARGRSNNQTSAEFAAQVMQSPFFEIAKRRDTQSQTNYGPALFGAAAMQREAILSDRAGVFTTSVAAPS